MVVKMLIIRKQWLPVGKKVCVCIISRQRHTPAIFLFEQIGKGGKTARCFMAYYTRHCVRNEQERFALFPSFQLFYSRQDVLRIDGMAFGIDLLIYYRSSLEEFHECV